MEKINHNPEEYGTFSDEGYPCPVCGEPLVEIHREEGYCPDCVRHYPIKAD